MFRWFLSSCLSTLYSSSACDGLSLTAESTHVALGGTVVITCTTQITYDNSMALKKVYPEDPLKPYVDMSDNQFLNAPFKDIDRYGMSHIEHPDSVFEFILTITGKWPCFYFAYPFPDVAALMDLLYISRYSAVGPTLQTLAPIPSSPPHTSPKISLAFVCFFGLLVFLLVLISPVAYMQIFVFSLFVSAKIPLCADVNTTNNINNLFQT